MRTITEFVRGGIDNRSSLQEALQLAMQLEFATIPPYLCAQWSVKSDPDRVEGVLHRIVSQEMQHLALAGNLLAAIGGKPQLASPNFIPSYPTNELPGGIAQQLAIDLLPLTAHQVEVFMQIEYPEFPPIAIASKDTPATIGEFYDSILKAFESINPPIDANAYSIIVPDAPVIRSVGDATAIIGRIQIEGEGLQDSPSEPSGDHTSLAHYYAFKELYVGRRLIKNGKNWSFTGDIVRLPEVYAFERGAPSNEFSETFTKLLQSLENCWKYGFAPDVALMLQLEILGRELIEGGLCPDFTWSGG
jgi:hypothetical protein